MNNKKLANYAIWFSTDDRVMIESALDVLWSMIRERYQVVAIGDHPPEMFKPWLKVGDNFYLMHTDTSWSPGDVCGFIRMKKLLPDYIESMAIAIGKDWYIPHHGLNNNILISRLKHWSAQVNNFELMPKA